ncbi:MAG: MoaD/ThiS family protein [Chloroflexi bacterium]|nr:MoaD/ThiS family protein [Chloroflexota bacterium]
MHVNFYATLRLAAGRKQVEVSLSEPDTVRAALEAASRDLPQLASELWEAPGQLYDTIHVFVNGREACFLPQQLETPLGPDDVLDVFPPVGGGSAGTRCEREYRSLPIWLAHEYLRELGGRGAAGQPVEGPGWRARVRDADDVVIGVLHIGRIFVDFEGNESAVAAAMAAFDAKALRAGG